MKIKMKKMKMSSASTTAAHSGPNSGIIGFPAAGSTSHESGNGLMAIVKKIIIIMVMVEIVVFLPQTLVSAKEEEDRDYWYNQAKNQMDELKAARRASKGYAKNVILFVGDGMGLSTVTAGRILKGQRLGQSGEGYRLSFEKFPFIALAKTYNLDSQIGDSSACATALMCGVKANINTVGLDHRGKFEDCRSSYSSGVPSIIDWAQKHGKSTGIVTNTRLTHGTPSALYAKTPSRYWEDDAKVPPRSHAACKDIARQLVENQPGRNINVLLGGGRRHWIPITEYDREEREQRGRRSDGRNLLDAWVHDKKTRNLNAEYVWNKAQFDNVDPRYTDYLLGIFGYSHLDFEADRNKGPDGDPSLAEMTGKAIEVLQKNPHGFFLMVEAGRIDHAHHHNNGRRALEEVDALDEAVLTALNLTDVKDTLIVLTADHSHVFTLGGDNTPRGHPLTGLDVEMSDVDGKPYTILLYGNGPGYAHSTPTGRQDLTGFNTQDINFVQQAAVPRKYETHGGEDVPVYAQGPGSYLFSGTVEQTYIPHAIAYASCISDDNTHCEKPPSDDACASIPASGQSQSHVPPPISVHHSDHDNVVVHLPDQDLDPLGMHDPRTAYEPYPIHDSLPDDYDPYPAHAPASIHDSDPIRDPISVHDHISIYDTYSANNPAPVHDPASAYDSHTGSNSYGGSNPYSNSDPYSDTNGYSGASNPFAAPNPYAVNNPVPGYDHYPGHYPSLDRNQDHHGLPPIHDSYPEPNPYPVQNPIPVEVPNPAPAAIPVPAPTSRRPLGHTTPATEDQRRSRDPYSWSGASRPLLLWTSSFRWYTLITILVATLVQIGV
ncbi:alkaline phosphatase-like [Macrobrachium rosenbergii]|uniref:alkaline phosphatase-like n=1 Tax=Macrobrachium rosenbergii TaxID=79674 RepID=UPI0034D529D6